MNEEIPQLLKNLRLRKMAEIVEGELAAASKASPSYSELLARLLRAEWLDQRADRSPAQPAATPLPNLSDQRAFLARAPELISHSQPTDRLRCEDFRHHTLSSASDYKLNSKMCSPCGPLLKNAPGSVFESAEIPGSASFKLV